MKAKFVYESIKHLTPRSEQELERNYANLDPDEKLLVGLENSIEDLVKKAIKEDENLKEIGELFLKNKVISIGMDTCVTVRHNKIDTLHGENDEAYFLDFINNHSIKYKVLQESGPGGGWPLIEYTGRARDIIKLLMGPFDSGLDGYEEIEEPEMCLGLEED